MDAMTTMGMDTDEQSDVIQIVSGDFKAQYFLMQSILSKLCPIKRYLKSIFSFCNVHIFIGILHLGNILFSTVGGGETAEVELDDRKI